MLEYIKDEIQCMPPLYESFNHVPV